MINEIFDNLMEELREDEKETFFFERTHEHIDRVQDAAEHIVSAHPEFEKLLEQVEKHDASKFEEPEKVPYVELTWKQKLEKEGKEYKVSADMEKQIVQATLHHIKNNRHHPEYHLEDKSKANLKSTNRDESIELLDATRMPDLDVAEMVADWQAMAEELGTNTAREWFDEVRDVRWHFSEEQEKLIDELLQVFE